MKTRLFFILTVASMLSFTSANANNNERIYDLGGTSLRFGASSSAKVLTVSIENISAEGVNITLEDTDGNVFVSETVKNTTSFTKRYNVSALESGSYRFVVKKKALKTIQPFEITSKFVLMYESERKEKFTPTISNKGDKLDINVLNGNYTNVTVNIYDNTGKKVFDEKNYVVLTLNKRYDLSKLPAGAYVVEVIAGDETQYYNLNL